MWPLIKITVERKMKKTERKIERIVLGIDG